MLSELITLLEIQLQRIARRLYGFTSGMIATSGLFLLILKLQGRRGLRLLALSPRVRYFVTKFKDLQRFVVASGFGKDMPDFVICGGEPGKHGRNLVFYADGRVVDRGGKNSVSMGPGDVYNLETPGGGGYGKVESEDDPTGPPSTKRQKTGAQKVLQSGSLFSYKLLQESA